MLTTKKRYNELKEIAKLEMRLRMTLQDMIETWRDMILLADAGEDKDHAKVIYDYVLDDVRKFHIEI